MSEVISNGREQRFSGSGLSPLTVLGFSLARDELGYVSARIDLLCRLSESLGRVEISGPHMTSFEDAVVRHLPSGSTAVEPDALDVCSVVSVVR